MLNGWTVDEGRVEMVDEGGEEVTMELWVEVVVVSGVLEKDEVEVRRVTVEEELGSGRTSP